MEVNETFDLERLVESYPQLEERAIVDFINGFDVMSDHLSEKRKSVEKGPSTRFFEMLTGHAAKRQELIDSSVQNNLLFVKSYIVSNEARLAKNERFVQAVMAGVGLISTKLKEVAGDTAALRDSFCDLSEKVSRLEEQEQLLSRRLEHHELYYSAMTEKNLALSVFALKDDLLHPEQKLWLMLTRLKYGDFGRWVASTIAVSEEQKKVHDALRTLRNECVHLLAQQTGRLDHELIDRETLFRQLIANEEVLRDALCLVSDADSNVLESVILACNSDKAFTANDDLPFVFSNVSIVEEMSRVLEPSGGNYASY